MASASPGRTTYMIGRLEREVRHRLAEVVGRYGLTVAHLTLLSVLRARGSLSNAQLAKRSLITPQSANEITRLLEQKRWISRTADPAHGRIIRISLTKQGQRMLAECDEDLMKLERLMLKDFSVGERSDLLRYLRQCSQNLDLMDMES